LPISYFLFLNPKKNPKKKDKKKRKYIALDFSEKTNPKEKR